MTTYLLTSLVCLGFIIMCILILCLAYELEEEKKKVSELINLIERSKQ